MVDKVFNFFLTPKNCKKKKKSDGQTSIRVSDLTNDRKGGDASYYLSSKVQSIFHWNVFRMESNFQRNHSTTAFDNVGENNNNKKNTTLPRLVNKRTFCKVIWKCYNTSLMYSGR